MKGSKKRILDLIESDNLINKLNEKLSHLNVTIDSETDLHFPNKNVKNESQLTTFLKKSHGENLSNELRAWWLANSNKGKLPTWDFISTCKINESKGLILVEAKAHASELIKFGKTLNKNASEGSTKNHECIEKAINAANSALKKENKDINISVDSCYQLSNRIAFSWWLAEQGIPVVLVYLGFLDVKDMEEKHKIFTNANDWEEHLNKYLKRVGAHNSKNEWVHCQKSKFILASMFI